MSNVPQAESAPSAPNTTTVVATWRGGRRYEVGRPGGPTVTIDGAGEVGTGPVDTLLGALASCAAIDVELYLSKRRTVPERMVVTVRAERQAAAPRRVVRAHLEFAIDGASIELEHAERAVALSLERYCSVASSLSSDIVLETEVVVNGRAGAGGALA